MKAAAICNPQRKTIFVSVTKGISGKMAPDIIPGQTPPIDCARGCWRLDPANANQCDWLMAVDKGIVKGVYEIDKKFLFQKVKAGCIPTRSKIKTDPTRYYCKLKDISAGHPCMNTHVRMYRSVQYS